MIVELLAFLFGASLLLYFSPKVVEAASLLAKSIEIDPLIIGLIIVAFGTSLPEITNSVISSVTGHADINTGNAIGSGISQISLMFGISILISGYVKGEKDKILFLGGCATIAAILGVSMVTKGYLSRLDGGLLITSYFILVYFISSAIRRDYFKVETEEAAFKAKTPEYAWRTVYTMIGVVIGSLISIYMLIELSNIFGISEYIMSYFLMSINTSIPELFIAISALRKKEYGIAIGDIFGSNIADITLSMGIGPLVKPNYFSSPNPLFSGLYLVIITALITLYFGHREKLERKEAIVMIGLYFLSFLIVL